MFNIEISSSFESFNFDKIDIEIICPQCNFYNNVYFKQIKYNDAVICRGCNITIKLEDNMSEVSKSEKIIINKIRSIGKIFG